MGAGGDTAKRGQSIVGLLGWVNIRHVMTKGSHYSKDAILTNLNDGIIACYSFGKLLFYCQAL